MTGFPSGVAFEQKPHLGDLAQIVRGYGRNLEAFRRLGNDQSFRGEPAQQFAERTDARTVTRLHAFKLETLPRRETAEQNVGSKIRRYAFSPTLASAASAGA